MNALTGTSPSTPDQQIPDTIMAGLSTWSNPLAALQNIPAYISLVQIDGYQMFALGALIPAAVLAVVLVGAFAGSGRRRR